MLNDHLDERAEYPYGRRDLTDEVTFYAVSDERFFVGMVGLINSLRLMGYEQRVVVLDCGLTEHQRNVLNPECELVVLPDSQALNPQLLKPFANLMHPKGTVVILDSDLVITRPLDPMLQAARNGKVCVCADPESERWFAEWEQLFGLPRAPRHQRSAPGSLPSPWSTGLISCPVGGTSASGSGRTRRSSMAHRIALRLKRIRTR
jgi:hypothetical protein